MAKNKLNPKASALDRAITEVVVPSADVQVLTYVGPVYTRGIAIDGTPGLVRPAEWTPDQIAAFLANHPRYAHWFEHSTIPESPESPATDEP